MFCSLNICRTTNKSRRDDFESIFYVLIYLLNKFRLPWSKLSNLKPYTPERMGYILGERLTKDMIDQVINLCPPSLRTFLIEAQKAKFESTPNYQGLRNALMSELYKLRRNDASPLPGLDSPGRQQENADSWGSAMQEQNSAGNQSQPKLLGNSQMMHIRQQAPSNNSSLHRFAGGIGRVDSVGQLSRGTMDDEESKSCNSKASGSPKSAGKKKAPF